MARNQNSLRLLAVFALLVAFLFGQALGLQHFGQYGGEMHWLSDHAASTPTLAAAPADATNQCDKDENVGALCDLSVLAATSFAADMPITLHLLPMAVVEGQFAPPVQHAGEGYVTRAPPGRGPPQLS